MPPKPNKMQARRDELIKHGKHCVRDFDLASFIYGWSQALFFAREHGYELPREMCNAVCKTRSIRHGVQRFNCIKVKNHVDEHEFRTKRGSSFAIVDEE
jgi:hypothetical protein